MINNATLIEAIEDIVSDKGITRDVVIEGLKEGFQKAYEKFFDTEARLRIDFDAHRGTLKIYQELTVVDNVEDEWLEIDIKELNRKLEKHNYKLGDIYYKELALDEDFSRLAINQVRQILQQKIKMAERAKIYDQFIDQEHQILRGKVVGLNEQQTSYLINIGGSQMLLWNKKIIPNEKFTINEYINVYLEEVLRESRFSQVILSRTHPDFLGRLIEQQVPEISEGLIEIKQISREPGIRAKVAVYANDSSLDPVGAIIGHQGNRIRQVSHELKDENIDVILWSPNREQYLMNAMSPVRVISIEINENENEANVIVPNEQLSLAIGKRGVNVRLVANLVKLKLNIMSFSRAKEFDWVNHWNGNISPDELQSTDFINATNQRRHHNQEPNNTPSVRDMNLEALKQVQAEIEEAQINPSQETPLEINNVDENLTIEDFQKDLDLDEISKNIHAFDNLDDDPEENNEDAIDEDDYENYYK